MTRELHCLRYGEQEIRYEIVRRPTGQVAHVQVDWAEDMPGRIAAYYGQETGCSVLPIGAPEDVSNPAAPLTEPERESVPEERIVESAVVDGGEGVAMPQGALGDVLSDAFADRYGAGRTTAVLVRQVGPSGTLVEEEARYAPGFDEDTPQRTWSVAKSIAATLVGAAVLSGEYEVSDPVGLDYWRAGAEGDPRNAITIDHALRMATGRYSDTPGNRTDPLYWGGTTVDERAANWPIVHKPGTVYRYANNDTLLLLHSLKTVLGDATRYLRFPYDELFGPLGMHHTWMETDHLGNFIGSSQVYTTARDLARFGILYADDGMWQGERLLPEGWTEFVATPAPSRPPQAGELGYGAQFWLLDQLEGIPAGTYTSMGNKGQYVTVVPERDVVIVRTGVDPLGARFDLGAFVRDVLAAL
jgi:CubicO group peptidase (beta-lactamase class C family)